MSRDVISFTIDDLSAFTKSLRRALKTSPTETPGQVEMLGHVARAAGYRNFQHLRSQHSPKPLANRKRVGRALRYFSDAGLWQDWPLKRGTRELCLWVIWSRLQKARVWTEREISAEIDQHTGFRDAAQIRRSLIEMGLLTRNIDGSRYSRVEREIDVDALCLLAELKQRAKLAAK